MTYLVRPLQERIKTAKAKLLPLRNAKQDFNDRANLRKISEEIESKLTEASVRPSVGNTSQRGGGQVQNTKKTLKNTTKHNKTQQNTKHTQKHTNKTQQITNNTQKIQNKTTKTQQHLRFS